MLLITQEKNSKVSTLVDAFIGELLIFEKDVYFFISTERSTWHFLKCSKPSSNTGGHGYSLLLEAKSRFNFFTWSNGKMI